MGGRNRSGRPADRGRRRTRYDRGTSRGEYGSYEYRGPDETVTGRRFAADEWRPSEVGRYGVNDPYEPEYYETDIGPEPEFEERHDRHGQQWADDEEFFRRSERPRQEYPFDEAGYRRRTPGREYVERRPADLRAERIYEPGGASRDARMRNYELDRRYGEGTYRSPGRYGYDRGEGYLQNRDYASSVYYPRNEDYITGYGAQDESDWRAAQYRRGMRNEGYASDRVDYSPRPWERPEGSSRYVSGGPADQPEGGHRGKGPKNYVRSDERMLEDISEAFSEDDYLDASEISVEVKDAVAKLSGEVTEKFDKRRAEELAENCPGIRDVQNSIKIIRNLKEESTDTDDRTEERTETGKSAASGK